MHRSTLLFSFLILTLLLGVTGVPSVAAAAPTPGAPAAAQSVEDLPAGARLAASASIGQAEPAYHFSGSPAGWQAASAASGLQTRLTPAAALLTGENFGWDMRLRAWGYGANVSSQAGFVEEAEVNVEANRAEYRRAGIREWYINGPFGVQQGFTLDQPPAAGQDSQVSLVLDLTGWQALIDAERTSATLEPDDRSTLLSYSSLMAWDAAGRQLPAWLETGETDGSRYLALRVETGGAAFPVTIDPIIRIVRLTAATAPNDNFGFAVAVSDNGRRAVIGAYQAAVNGSLNQGAAYVFWLNQTFQLASPGPDGAPAAAVEEWVYEARLDSELGSFDGNSGDRFGISVAISGDADTIVVGADRADPNGSTDQGAAYVFSRTQTGWAAQGQLTAADGEVNDWMGWSVATDDVGDHALISAHMADIGSLTDNGAAYLFGRAANGSWSQVKKFGYTLSTGAHLGYSVAINIDSKTVLLGAQGSDQAVSYTESGGTWTAQTVFTHTEGHVDDFFGRSVDLSADGTVALIGASGMKVGENAGQGAAYVFIRAGNGWAQVARLVATDGKAGDAFGVSVALMGETYVAYIGAYQADLGASADNGAVYGFVWTQAINNWMQAVKFTADDGVSDDQYGVSVALGGDTLLIGARGANVALQLNQGAAYAYRPQNNQMVATRLFSAGAQSDMFGYSVALSDDGSTALIGAYREDVGDHVEQGAAYVFSNENGLWRERYRITTAAGDANDHFGYSVALNGDGTTALIGAVRASAGGSADRGAAYVFKRSGATWDENRKLTLGDEGGSGDMFGYSAALSDSGLTALVGAPFWDAAGAADAGTAAMFDLAVTGQPPVLLENTTAGDMHGSSVALSGSGLVAVVGAPYTDLPQKTNQGRARVYMLTGSGWQTTAALLPSDGAASDVFGFAVAVDDAGQTAVVSAPYKGNQGKVYVFTRTNTTWSQPVILTATQPANGALFGMSVAISGDGRTILSGAPNAGLDGPLTGVVTPYLWTGASWQAQQPTTGSVYTGQSQAGWDTCLSDDGLLGLSGAPTAGGFGQGEVSVLYFQSPGGKVFVPMTVRQ